MCRSAVRFTVFMLLSFCLKQSIAQGQSILSGKVVNEKGVGLTGVTLHVLNTAFTVLTDDQGHFQLPFLSPGSYQLECTGIGYATRVVEIEAQRTAEIPAIKMLPTAQQLDAVVVTAEKREVVAQKLPLSLSVISAAKAEQYRIWNIRDLSGIAPNLYLAQSGDERNVTGIRGVTTTSYTPAVTTYIDGVNQFSLDTYIGSLFDIQRIEILRGPQGTLYGRNAMGGVINVVTKEPSNSLNGAIELGWGNYGQQRHNAALRVPLIKDKLFMGVATQWQSRQGYFTNEFNNTSFDRQRSLLSNAYLKYKPGKNWSFSINVKQHNFSNHGPFPLIQVQQSVQDVLDQGYKLNQNDNGEMRDRTSNASLVVQHDGAKVSFTSQTSYQSNYRYYRDPLDGDFSPLKIVSISNNYGKDWNRVNVWTQEFRFSSPASVKGPWNWTAGAYLFDQHNPVKQATNFGDDATLIGAEPNIALVNSSVEKSNGQALFGHIQYAASDRWRIIGGVRLDREYRALKVRGDVEVPGPFSLLYRSDTSASLRFSAFSPKAGLSYQLTDKNQVYVTVSKGFRAGGLTPLSADPSQVPLSPFKPEYSTSWEAGSKNSFLNGKWILNVDLFHTTINDLQVPTLLLPDGITVIRNSGKLLSIGAELEGSYLPLRNLSIDYALGLTQAKFQSFIPSTVDLGGQPKDLKGNRQVFTPDNTLLLAVQYGIDLNQKKSSQVWARAEWHHTGKVYFNVLNTLSQDPYNLFHLRAGVAFRDLEFSVWGRNITGTKYIAYAYDFGAVHLGNPATWGVSLKKKFY